jgi:hypothetical protein
MPSADIIHCLFCVLPQSELLIWYGSKNVALLLDHKEKQMKSLYYNKDLIWMQNNIHTFTKK